jgi:hypothetical protein
MNNQPLSPAAKYGPFAAVIAVLGLVLVLAPSKSPDRTDAFATSFAGGNTSTTVAGAVETTATTIAGALDAAATPTGAAAPSTSLSSRPTGTGTGSGGVPPSEQVASQVIGEDCARREFFGPTYTCKPLWEGDNGGATYKGVTEDTFTIAYYRTKANEAVNAVLASGGLGATDEEVQTLLVAYEQFFEERYQFWGRDLKIVTVYGTADSGDAAAFRADAVRIDQEVGAALVLGAGDLDMIDELARRGIPCLCGSQLPEKFHMDHAPYVFGLLPDGGTTNDHIAEFICKRLGPGSKADFSGEIIHPTIGQRGQVERRYGLAYPSGYWGNNNAADFKAKLAQCGIQIASESAYASDINTAGQQATANTQTAIQNKITTIICMCDPIAPVFGTSSATQQQYYPEWIQTGYLLQDAEALARLYDQDQWSHNFGVSSLGAQQKKEDTTWYRAFKLINPDEEPNASAGPLLFPAMQVSFIGIELAGPNYNPQTYAEGMFAIDTKSQGKTSVTFTYKPDDFGGIDDFREVWWSRSDTDINGDTGVYMGVNDHKRHLTGQWPSTPTKVFKRECTERGSCGEPA